jgi:3-deoxy-D-manno-octulosonic-acid transferase
MIGAPPERVRVLGNLKFDVRSVAEESAFAAKLRVQLPANARVLVCGSTLDDEEAALLDCLPALTVAVPSLVCILAPRHPERFDAVAQLLQQRGIAFTRRSQWASSNAQPLASVLLLDTVGELASVYALADVAFVGGSLIAAGGHNPLEPAQFGVPVVMGESYENFRGIVTAMRNATAIEITPRSALCAALTTFLTDTQRATSLGAAGQHVFLAESGATARTIAALLPLLRRPA